MESTNWYGLEMGLKPMDGELVGYDLVPITLFRTLYYYKIGD